MLNPVAMSIITNTFTDPRSGPAPSACGAASSASAMAAGPLVGGLLVESVGWRVDLLDQPAGRARGARS